MNILIVFVAKYVFLISIFIFLLFSLYLWFYQRKIFLSFFTLSIISFPLAYVTAKIFSHFIYDPRPFVSEHVKPLISHVADNGFPSDHMLLTMTIATIVFVYNKKLGILLAIIAIGVGTARVFANVHHIEDIVGSAVIAIATTYITLLMLPSVKKRFHIKC